MTVSGCFGVPIYNTKVKITVTDQVRRSVNSYIRKHDPTYDMLREDVGAYFYSPTDTAIYYIFFDINDVTRNYINHEKSHLVEDILSDRDIKPKDEVRAYLDGFISTKIEAFFNKRPFIEIKK